MIEEPGCRSKANYCYALWQPGVAGDRGRTYVGFTVDPQRRLKQHNGLLSGGAQRTRAGGHGSWELLFVVSVEDSALFGRHEALSLEWHLKVGRARARNARHPMRRGVERRLEVLAEALALPKFAHLLHSTVVTVDRRHVDAAWATLVKALPAGRCCVEVMPVAS